ncbi:MAG TPA: VIT1/CCC1 transporter family protein [Pyrinomonadaceae bacterium]|nr:VIT1/CCC1 transporter family protein [Pyrinomonadaceae bacterium]
MDRVSTGSGSDLVSDQDAIFLTNFGLHNWTRSLPLPVLTRSKNDDRARWVQTMLTDEYGLPREVRSPWIAALSTFTAFLICGLVPLLPYLLGMDHSLVISVVLTGIVFAVIGSIKSRWSTSSWWHSGLTTLFVGAIAASLAYFAGVIVKQLVD